MSDETLTLMQTAETLFGRMSGTLPDHDWQEFSEAGFPMLLVPEIDGGFGADWSTTCRVLEVAGRRALSLPVPEPILGAALLAQGGLDWLTPRTTIAPRATGTLGEGRFRGELHAVPWGANADCVLFPWDDGVWSVQPKPKSLRKGLSPADVPHPTLTVDAAATRVGPTQDVEAALALAYSAMMAGAMAEAMTLTKSYVQERQQFGRPISKFQAVQQSMALFAEEVAAAGTVVSAAARAADHSGEVLVFEAFSAKLRCNMAAERVIALSHQLHGAIGFSREYALQPLTRRLMGWRSVAGNDRSCALRLGRIAAGWGNTGGFWREITRRSDQMAE